MLPAGNCGDITPNEAGPQANYNSELLELVENNIKQVLELIHPAKGANVVLRMPGR